MPQLDRRPLQALGSIGGSGSTGGSTGGSGSPPPSPFVLLVPVPVSSGIVIGSNFKPSPTHDFISSMPYTPIKAPTTPPTIRSAMKSFTMHLQPDCPSFLWGVLFLFFSSAHSSSSLLFLVILSIERFYRYTYGEEKCVEEVVHVNLASLLFPTKSIYVRHALHD